MQIYIECPVRIYPLAAVKGDSPTGRKPVFCYFTFKLKKIIKNYENNENKMLKSQNVHKINSIKWLSSIISKINKKKIKLL